jgi:potassium-transporting ATPase KdpC subunit
MIKKETITALKVFIILSILVGLIYPLAITLIAKVTMPNKANGSLITQNGKILGSKLIGQTFTKPEYFNSRPSAVDYDASGSGGSNLGPSSKKLMDEVAKRVAQARTENNIPANKPVPADMTLTSASGLDPHISVENALLQVSRISKIRHIPESELKQLIKQNTDPDFMGIWGQSGVNVLKLNLALDNTKK